MIRALVFAALLVPSVAGAQPEPRDKAWHLAHPLLSQCKPRARGDETVLPFCAAAAQSAMQDAQWR